MALVGSSKNHIGASERTARVIARRCHCPPDSSLPPNEHRALYEPVGEICDKAIRFCEPERVSKSLFRPIRLRYAQSHKVTNS